MAREAVADQLVEIDLVQAAVEISLPISRPCLAQVQRSLKGGVWPEPFLSVEYDTQCAGGKREPFHRLELE